MSILIPGKRFQKLRSSRLGRSVNWTRNVFMLLALFSMTAVAMTGLASTKPERPNVVLILADDLGFSDISCYGGETATPNIDSLAANGVRFTQFYNGARCCPSRASLMTGLYPHQAQVGDMVDEYARPVREFLKSAAYADRMNPHTPTIAEALKTAGYRTYMSGKWHLGYRTNEWPYARGFDRSFSVIEGAMNYYGFGMQHTGVITNPPMAMNDKVFVPPHDGFFATEAFTDFAVRCIAEHKETSQPFFMYLAYTAPHWPLHAKPENIARYRGKFKEIGWDKLREQRHARLKEAGIIDSRWPVAPRPESVPAWSQASPQQKDRWDEKMAIYAAQLWELDQGVGRVLKALRDAGSDTNTVVFFLSDNGGAAENPRRTPPGAVLGTRESYEGYGLEGAHVSCTPFRKTKKYSHEGGISAPLIASWPAGISPTLRGQLVKNPAHLIDLMPTCLQLAKGSLPRKWNGDRSTPLEGTSLAPAFRGKELARSKPIFWEHEGHRAIRDGKWKLVASHDTPWELYDMEADRTESHDLSKERPEKVRELVAKYEAWAKRAGVESWPNLQAPQPKPAKHNEGRK